MSLLQAVVRAALGAGMFFWVALAGAAALPPPVQAALERARLPPQALALWLAPAADPQAPPRLAWRAQEAMNPASVMKLVTTWAALDQLGPAYTWQTPVYLDGRLDGTRLQGNVYIQGRGDPKLVLERLWLLLRRLQAQGVQQIAGDIVLDRSAFSLPAHDPGAFDGEPQRAYNVAPDALLVNYQALVLNFVPDSRAGLVRVSAEPPLAGLQLPASLPLAPAGTACGDWRAHLQLDVGDGQRLRFAGSYPASCSERSWALALPEPQTFAARAVQGMWQALGGQLTGQVREGRVPAGLQPVFSQASPPLAEVLRDINKYSNNVMTQQLLLTLGLERGAGGSFEAGRAVVERSWRAALGEAPLPVLDNGAGLSREARISAEALGRMLQRAWAAPFMPEYVASLPIVGVDGTLRRNTSRAAGQAHLKTGSLRDVMALAGYVDGADGQRWVLVALVNHANAAAARPVLDALLEWAQQGR